MMSDVDLIHRPGLTVPPENLSTRLGPTMVARPLGTSQHLKGNPVFIRKSQVAGLLIHAPISRSSFGVHQDTGHKEAAVIAREGQYTGMRYHSCHRLSDAVHRYTHSTEGRVGWNVCADLIPKWAKSLFRPVCLGLARRFGRAILDAGECLRRSGEPPSKNKNRYLARDAILQLPNSNVDHSVHRRGRRQMGFGESST